jgi:ABC-type sugar transport system ATPase subunit
MAGVRFEGVAKHFDGRPVLAPLDLAIADGEFFTFLGPSGCGKSTLLNLVAGVDAPTSGAIWLDAERIDRLPPGERDVAMVFQSYALYPHLTARGNIAFPLVARGIAAGEIRARVDAVADALGLSALLNRRPLHLSGGERQRVALARALVRRPRVFLMDEPLSNLDARLRLEMREELARLHAEHRITTIYVTHDQEEAMVLSDRVAVLSEGRVQQCGAPLAVYDEPENLFVARFVGSPPMNILDPGVAPEQALPWSVPESVPFPSATLFGVRPADVAVLATPRSGARAADAVLVEATGSERWVVCDWHGQRIRGRAAPDVSIGAGRSIYIDIRPERVHAFDRTTGRRIAAPPLGRTVA